MLLLRVDKLMKDEGSILLKLSSIARNEYTTLFRLIVRSEERVYDFIQVLVKVKSEKGLKLSESESEVK